MSIVSQLVGPVTGLLDKFIEDKDQKAALAHEAAHKSLFVAGWRPAIGWVCALGLFYNVILANIIGIWVDVPEVDTTLLVPVMMGMLGIGAMRSYEKVKGVSREK